MSPLLTIDKISSGDNYDTIIKDISQYCFGTIKIEQSIKFGLKSI